MKTRTRTGLSAPASFILGFAACGVLAAAIATGPRNEGTPATTPPADTAATPAISDEHAVFAPAPTPQASFTYFEAPNGLHYPEFDFDSCTPMPWEETSANDVPSEVLAAAKESVDAFDLREAYIARLGSITLYTLGGQSSGHEIALVLTEQGTVLQADAATAGDAIPEEVASFMRERFPTATLSNAGVTQMVTFWAKLTTPDGRHFNVRFDPNQGLEVSDACTGTEADFFAEPTFAPQTGADPRSLPFSPE
ncbi:MAG: hypothetical protein AB7K52_11435 [Phycisphaerales bacterium]